MLHGLWMLYTYLTSHSWSKLSSFPSMSVILPPRLFSMAAPAQRSHWRWIVRNFSHLDWMLFSLSLIWIGYQFGLDAIRIVCHLGRMSFGLKFIHLLDERWVEIDILVADCHLPHLTRSDFSTSSWLFQYYEKCHLKSGPSSRGDHPGWFELLH